MSSEIPVKKILVLSANPEGTNPLRLGKEIREISEGLQLSRQRDKFKIESAQAARYRDIQRSILSHKPQIVHFCGHGAGESGLVFEDEIGQQKLVDAQALAGFFKLFADKVECVVLNACYSQIQAKAIAKHIDYVIGMSKEIGDKAAIEFAVGFYDALGDGSEFEFAYKYGCSSIRMAGIAEHLTPQLLRKQDDSGDNIQDATPQITPLPPNSRQTIVVSPPPPPSIIQTQPFEFETATLTVRSITQTSPGFLGFGKETSTSTSCEINRSRKQAQSFQEDLGNGIFLEMVKIPGGSFLMGSPENELERSDDESPQHKVTIQQFFMGKFQVTQEQYQAIMGENPSRFKGKNKPVECVSWDNAVDFCGKISKRTGKTYRLPSEAEWEYACRAGTTTPFYFGETITTDLANYDGDYTYGSAPKGQYRKQTIDVGKFPANAFGLYDMHGNVWEWCEDSWHDNYQGAPNHGIPWLNEENKRMLRGGSWLNYPANCRSASRNRRERVNTINYIGFRVVVNTINNIGFRVVVASSRTS